AIKGQVGPLKDRSANAFKLCFSRASTLEVFSSSVIGGREHTETPKSPLPSAQAGGAANTEELQRRVETSLDAPSMEALGLAYLEARQVYLAQLVLGRTTELADNRASA